MQSIFHRKRNQHILRKTLKSCTKHWSFAAASLCKLVDDDEAFLRFHENSFFCLKNVWQYLAPETPFELGHWILHFILRPLFGRREDYWTYLLGISGKRLRSSSECWKSLLRTLIIFIRQNKEDEILFLWVKQSSLFSDKSSMPVRTLLGFSRLKMYHSIL